MVEILSMLALAPVPSFLGVGLSAGFPDNVLLAETTGVAASVLLWASVVLVAVSTGVVGDDLSSDDFWRSLFLHVWFSAADVTS